MSLGPFRADKAEIIFAEDDLVFREIASPALQRVGITDDRIHMAENGVEALQELEALQPGAVEEPILMLLDMRMPLMDGQTCALQVRQMCEDGKLRRVPYLVCCSAGVNQVAYGGEDGADTTFHLTMPKPFSNKEVDLVLQNAEKWWLAGASVCGAPAADMPAAGASPSSPSGAPPASSGPRGEFSVDQLELIVADSEPICRMALVTALTLLGVDEEKVVECDSEDEFVPALQAAQANRSDPLLVVLGNQQWLQQIKSCGPLDRKPFVGCMSLGGDSISDDGVDVVLPPGYQQPELKALLAKMQQWWTR
mmetsp:Transcript_45546/g.97670  ORF Transcript_45546/g.97670 Transcript_45546/m.97670 type:complete len:309 (-) Transcript_45546:213-1139(-)|eukprot:CAMPEP_0206480690 /NCGR_PEP_ID=MMETSP0324_2-20121206/37571_1 /ASSEMBLY_ACC=CAM_ASM_000836 /TAXON_ID=2866 /ORGANISM="Crypthecodinium cohnii, Strain Seligo" /LENGTH=308 /DNA_ID=CAMNT_0053957779 /DNA_START=420 /DNA_END=1346 /DNA_ORIENTATION=+